MDKFVNKASFKRNKQWKVIESDDDCIEIMSSNLNQSRGEYVNRKVHNSTTCYPDIRSFEKHGTLSLLEVTFIDPRSIIEKTQFPLLRCHVYPSWFKKDREWFLRQYLRGITHSASIINTSFPLIIQNSNNVQEMRIVNTRTVDMEFSPSSKYLAVACNCIKGGYISIIHSSSLLSDESTIHSCYNDVLNKSTQFYYKVWYS